MNSEPKAVVLLSGGMDSATVLAMAIADAFQVIAVTFRYGQRHEVEIEAARNTARAHGVSEHLVVDVDPRVCAGSALTTGGPVPKDRDLSCAEIPPTYVPARNTIFLAHALAVAEARGARDIYIGVNAVDYSGYPDCRPEYVAAFEHLAQLATRAGVEGQPVRLHAPLLHMRKADILRAGLALGVDYARTRSCYDPDASGRGCGHCDSCRLRRAAFAELGMADPAPYQSS